MARPTRRRRVCELPEHVSFVPQGKSEAGLVVLTVDEYELVRLIDYEHLTHAQCAAQMKISRTTVTESYERARQKISDSLVNGKRLVIEGGDFTVCEGPDESCLGVCPHRAGGKETEARQVTGRTQNKD